MFGWPLVSVARWWTRCPHEHWRGYWIPSVHSPSYTIHIQLSCVLLSSGKSVCLPTGRGPGPTQSWWNIECGSVGDWRQQEEQFININIFNILNLIFLPLGCTDNGLGLNKLWRKSYFSSTLVFSFDSTIFYFGIGNILQVMSSFKVLTNPKIILILNKADLKYCWLFDHAISSICEQWMWGLTISWA